MITWEKVLNAVDFFHTIIDDEATGLHDSFHDLKMSIASVMASVVSSWIANDPTTIYLTFVLTATKKSGIEYFVVL